MLIRTERKHRTSKNNSGFVYIMAMAMMVIFATLGLAYIKIAKSSLQVGQDEFKALKAFYYAESAVEHSFAEVRSGSDPDGDGVGNVNWALITPEGELNSFAAIYDTADKKITATGIKGDAQRKMVLKLRRENLTGAIQSGGAISTGGAHTGTVNGDVDSRSTINLGTQLTVNGTVTQNETSLVIPTVRFFPCLRNEAQPDHRKPGGQTWSLGPPNGDGLYYVSGNLTIDTDFQLNGTLVVNGALTILNIPSGRLRIIPDGDNPAIVAQSLQINNTQDAFLDGLVYTSQNASFMSNSGLQVNGAIVTGTTLAFNSMNALSIISHDPSMDPPVCFDNLGGLVNAVWIGHSN